MECQPEVVNAVRPGYRVKLTPEQIEAIKKELALLIGPQKQPASVPQIEVQQKQVARELAG
jgi:actin-like ATPase involved in cell morphogenesis